MKKWWRGHNSRGMGPGVQEYIGDGSSSTIAGLFLSVRKQDASVILRFPKHLGFHLSKVCSFLMNEHVMVFVLTMC